MALWFLVWLPDACILAAQPADTEERIGNAALRVEEAATRLGEAAAEAQLARIFRVKPRVISDLHDQKLDYGEVAVVLALAEAGHASPDAVLGLWATGRLNWGEIAERLKVNTSGLLQHLQSIRQELARRAP